jgi:CheY-like chemotaxis protein
MAAGSTSPRIVVADDDPGFLTIVSALLERAGYSTLAVLSGEEALAAVRGEDVCLLILDIRELFDRVSGILVGAPTTSSSRSRGTSC